MKVLFTPLAEIGHVNPLVGICQQLVQRGHELALHCRQSFAASLERAGVRATWFGAIDKPRLTAPQALATSMREPRWLKHWYARAFATTAAEVESIGAVCKTFRPDVMCVDPLNAGAAIVAERERIPWAGVATNFAAVRPEGWSCAFLDVGAQVVPTIAPVAATHGVHALRFASTDAISPWFNTVFTTEDVIPRAQTANRHSYYVGPARVVGSRGDEPAFPWDRVEGRRIVYVSSGGGHSLGFDAALLVRLARAIDLDDITLVIAAPGLHEDAAFRDALPSACVVVAYAPQRALLARAKMAVTHGGVNSFNECIENACPMLVLPLGMEQPLQGELARRTGAGLTLDVLGMTDDDCRGALRSLLEGTTRDRVTALQASYRATDSTARICDALELLASGGRLAWPTSGQ